MAVGAGVQVGWRCSMRAYAMGTHLEVDKTRACKYGDPADPHSEMGTVIDQVRPGMTVVREESFGPVSPIGVR